MHQNGTRMGPEDTPDPVNHDRLPQTHESDPDMPILVRPVPTPRWPTAISTARVLNRLQVALVMIGGNCSFGFPLLVAIVWPIERFDLHENAAGVGIPVAWIIGFAAICTYAIFTNRWAGRADRRARTTVVIATAVLAGFTALTLLASARTPGLAIVVLVAAAPSLIVQAFVLRCVYGPQGHRWFERSGRVAREL
ncbi:hypothetical protein [Glycomyces paridis]|uniref:MFS transporter n=1 Tax=Glycomyces paridis TaxID=2126555 RepID=A0A4S8PEI8_9ACTN|nr:hypothetical protein [Glycomyces paridis]THV28301.1 hypothetical protein E9998_11845 [Glycomyces paridis]